MFRLPHEAPPNQVPSNESQAIPAIQVLSGRALKTPEDCAFAYTDLLDGVGDGRLTPEEAQTISVIVAKRAELFPSVELAAEIEALKAQLAAVVGTSRPPSPIRRSLIRDH